MSSWRYSRLSFISRTPQEASTVYVTWGYTNQGTTLLSIVIDSNPCMQYNLNSIAKDSDGETLRMSPRLNNSIFRSLNVYVFGSQRRFCLAIRAALENKVDELAMNLVNRSHQWH